MNNPSRTAFAAVLAIGLLATAPAQAARVVVSVRTAPPPPRVVVVPPPPRAHVVWTPGYWRWDGRAHVWVDGRYVDERPGRVWVSEHWVQRGPNWQFVPGHWRRT